MRVPAYDLATLQRAPHRWGLHVAGGLTVTHDWVARTAEGVCTTEAGGGAVSSYRDPVPRASYRATRRVLLEELQRHVDAHPASPAATLVADHAAGAGETAWYVQPDSGLASASPSAAPPWRARGIGCWRSGRTARPTSRWCAGGRSWPPSGAAARQGPPGRRPRCRRSGAATSRR